MPQIRKSESLIDFNLDLAFEDLEYPGIEIGGAFVELDIYLDKLAEVVPFVRDQALARMKAELESAASVMSDIDKEDKNCRNRMDCRRCCAEVLHRRFRDRPRGSV